MCAATLKPFETVIEKQFRTIIRESAGDLSSAMPIDSFAGWGEQHGNKLEVEDDWDEEVAVGGAVDLGEIAAQYMALSIDRYAKAPGHVPVTIVR